MTVLKKSIADNKAAFCLDLEKGFITQNIMTLLDIPN